MRKVQLLSRNRIWSGEAGQKPERDCFWDFWVLEQPFTIDFDPNSFERGRDQDLQIIPVQITQGDVTHTIFLVLGLHFESLRHSDSPQNLAEVVERFVWWAQDPNYAVGWSRFNECFEGRQADRDLLVWWSLDENYVCAWSFSESLANSVIESLKIQQSREQADSTVAWWYRWLRWLGLPGLSPGL